MPASDSGKIILANELLIAICEAHGVRPDRCSQVIIEAKAGDVVKIYFSMFGDNALFELVPPLLTAPNVRRYLDGDPPVEVTTAAA